MVLLFSTRLLNVIFDNSVVPRPVLFCCAPTPQTHGAALLFQTPGRVSPARGFLFRYFNTPCSRANRTSSEPLERPNFFMRRDR